MYQGDETRVLVLSLRNKFRKKRISEDSEPFHDIWQVKTLKATRKKWATRKKKQQSLTEFMLNIYTHRGSNNVQILILVVHDYKIISKWLILLCTVLFLTRLNN